MRLMDKDRTAIRATVAALFGKEARVLLFGSRTDDTRRGGDIDLLVELPSAPPDEERARLDLLVALQRALGERHMDILLTYPGARERDVDRVARVTGVPV